MAIFPCDLCRRRYAGKSNTVYIGWLAGSFTERNKLNLCGPHAAGVMQWVRDNLVLIERGGVMQTDEVEVSRTCESCRLEPSVQTWFANTFIRTEEPEVYASGLCEKCAARVSAGLPTAQNVV